RTDGDIAAGKSKGPPIKLPSGNRIATVVVPSSTYIHPAYGLHVANSRVIRHQGAFPAILIRPGRMLILGLRMEVSQYCCRLIHVLWAARPADHGVKPLVYLHDTKTVAVIAGPVRFEGVTATRFPTGDGSQQGRRYVEPFSA